MKCQDCRLKEAILCIYDKGNKAKVLFICKDCKKLEDEIINIGGVFTSSASIN